MTKPVELKRQPSVHLIRKLEQALSQAKAGELVGAVLLLSHGNSTSCVYAGHYNMGSFMLAFEDWKFQQMFLRNLEEIQEKNDG